MPYAEEFRPQRGQVSSAQLNKLVRASRDHANLFRPDSQLDAVLPKPFFAKILGYDSASGQYSFDEMEVYDGSLRVKPGGIEGRINGLGGWTSPTQYPAKEINSVADVSTNTIVMMYPTAPTVDGSGQLPHPNYRFVYQPLAPGNARMCRIVEPVELHPTLPAYKAYVQEWNATTNALEDDFLVWLRMY